MIGRLTGTVVSDAGDDVVVDVGGVGYEVAVPLGTLGRVKARDDGRVTLFVHTHVREDAFVLFAFADERERSVFRTLIGISNIGPKTALSVLSALPAVELARAVADKDVAGLTRVPGIGKKSAERLVLELTGKLDAFAGPVSPSGKTKSVPTATAATLTNALVGMGYRANDAERAVVALGERVRAEPLESLLRDALAVLSK
ncbi:MAG: Holliday junction branch migration protein RuvA [Polyangiaceae bacterium]